MSYNAGRFIARSSSARREIRRHCASSYSFVSLLWQRRQRKKMIHDHSLSHHERITVATARITTNVHGNDEKEENHEEPHQYHRSQTAETPRTNNNNNNNWQHDLEDDLWWWTQERTIPSVEESLQTLQQLISNMDTRNNNNKTSSSSSSFLDHSLIHAIIINWQMVSQQQQQQSNNNKNMNTNNNKTYTAQQMIQRLDRILQNSSTTIPGKSLSILIHMAAQQGQLEVAEDLMERILTMMTMMQQQQQHGNQNNNHDHDDHTDHYHQPTITASFSSSFTPSTHTLNTLLEQYTRTPHTHKMHALMTRWSDLQLPLDTTSYNLLLANLAHNQQAQRAEDYLIDICRGHYAPAVAPNLWTFHTVLTAWAHQGRPDRVQALIGRLYDPYDYGALTNIVPNTTTWNLLLLSHVKSSSSSTTTTKMDHNNNHNNNNTDAGRNALTCLREWQVWVQAGLTSTTAIPDVVSYGTVVDALCNHGHVQEAQELVEELYQQYMNVNHGQRNSDHETTTTTTTAVLPNVKLLTPILKGWSKTTLPDRLERAEQFFRFVQDWAQLVLEAPLDATIYNVMMSVYGTCAQTDAEVSRALDLLQEMKHYESSVKPNFATYSILVQLLLRHGEVETALELLNELQEQCQDDMASGEAAVCRPDARSMNQLIRCLARVNAPQPAAHLLISWCQALVQDQQTTKGEDDGAGPALSFSTSSWLSSLSPPDVATFGSVVAAYSRSNSNDTPRRAGSTARNSNNIINNSSNHWDETAEHVEVLVTWLHRLVDHNIMAQGPDYLLQRARLLCWSKARGKQAALQAHTVLRDMISLKQSAKRAANQTKDSRAPSGPDVMDYNLVLAAYCRHWQPRRADDLLQDMMASSRPGAQLFNRQSFHSVLLAWSRVNSVQAIQRLDELLQQVEDLSKKCSDMQPDVIAYNNVLQGWLRNCQSWPQAGDRSMELLQRMVASNQVSYLSFVTVIQLLLQLKKVDEAETVLQQLHRMCNDGRFARPQEQHYVAVAKAWEGVGRQDRASHVMGWWKALQK
jgi:pentatricopeptide repeat protein